AAPQQYKQSLIAFGLSSVAKATSFAPQQYKQSLIAFGLSSVQSVTMPALLTSSAQQSAKNKLQNRLDLITRTTLIS
ncbi:MAG: hypothetical protein KBT40_03225, partial [bacterium]|nr:hypothetical protein [Candidatus Minthenecus merdequi]